jgi:hypothetical protein
MSVLEQIKANPKSVLGLTVEYDYGGTQKLKFKVGAIKKQPWYWVDGAGVKHESSVVLIGSDVEAFYVVGASNVRIIN